ncbi:MAG TPA: hypothetical protein VF628_06105 [Allosphingosinicella sp.]|jgi:hypothetical protein
MPKMKPDRDDGRGQLDGAGGAQEGPIGTPEEQQAQRGNVSETSGAGGQRSPGGSSRDSQEGSNHG